ncbi:MAG: PEP-CTERM sorting domain-containing protein [Verrucomicrobiota bacterium]|nr:PEP-CTERM sorting domain-containing protein [Verrucomicrobiota bacterium]
MKNSTNINHGCTRVAHLHCLAFFAALVLLLMCAVMPRAYADASWVGGEGDFLWSSDFNWIGQAPDETGMVESALLVFDNNAGGSFTVDGTYRVGELQLYRDAYSLGFFAFNEGDSLTLTNHFTQDADQDVRFGVDVYANSVSGGEVRFDNAILGGALASTFAVNSLTFASRLSVMDSTLAFDNLGRQGYQIRAERGIEGTGNVSVGTGHFTFGTQLTLFSDSTFTGELRLRNNVDVVDTINALGQISGSSTVRIESPVDYWVNRARLAFGAYEDGIFNGQSSRLNDSALIVLRNGELQLQNQYSSRGINMIEDVGGFVLEFGHSAINLVNVASNQTPYALNGTSFTPDAGATAVIRGFNDAIPEFYNNTTLGQSIDGGTRFICGDLAQTIRGGGLRFETELYGIIPFLVGDTRTDGSEADTFVRYVVEENGGFLGVVPLATTDYLEDINLADPDGLDNVSTRDAVLEATRYVNSLRVQSESVLELGEFGLVVNSGALLLRGYNTISSGTDGYLDLNGGGASTPGYIYVYGYDSEIAARIVGDRGFTVSGDHTLILSGNNTYAGDTWLNTNVRALGSNAFGTSTVHLNQDVNLSFATSSTGGVLAAGEQSGEQPDGAVVYNGKGYSNERVYNNDFMVHGSGSRMVANYTSPTINGNVIIDLPNFTERAVLSIEAIPEVYTSQGFTFNGNIIARTNTDLFFTTTDTPFSSSRIIAQGGISEVEATLTVTTGGTGVTEFRADNNYSGATVVGSGTFLANNPGIGTGSATGSGLVYVEYSMLSPTQLGGIGRIAGDTRIKGAVLAPGVETSAIGTLNFGSNLTFEQYNDGEISSMPTLSIQLGLGNVDPLLSENDRIAFNGLAPTLDLSRSGTALELLVLAESPVGSVFRIADSEQPLIINGFFEVNGIPVADLETFIIESLYGPYTFQINYGPTRIDLVLAAIPEPSTYGLIFGLVLVAFVVVRRRKQGRVV